MVYVELISYGGDILDAIVIKNSFDTPFYLTENYQGVMSYNIYTRVMGTNTPKNKSVDIQYVEYLWKKRFRLISTPLERMTYYL